MEFLGQRWGWHGLLADTLQRLAETVPIEGLEQVIERMHFKRLEREAIIRGHKNDRARAVLTERLDNTEAIDFRHLYVQKEKIRLVKEQTKLIEQQNTARSQLVNEDFVNKAPKPLVDKIKQTLSQAEKELEEVMKKLETIEA